MIFILSGALVGLQWGGCKVDQDNYELLSTFFDGVPDPNAPKYGASIIGPSGQVLAIVSQHEPYVNESCRECHRSIQEPQLDKSDSSMCLTCHNEVLTAQEYMHGPVAGTACLWCHDPHMSAYENLLRMNPSSLCTQCHSAEMMVGASPAHRDLARNCLDCHSGHGGSDRFFLTTGGSDRVIPPGQPADESKDVSGE